VCQFFEVPEFSEFLLNITVSKDYPETTVEHGYQCVIDAVSCSYAPYLGLETAEIRLQSHDTNRWKVVFAEGRFPQFF
jgi:hypothetical protein